MFFLLTFKHLLTYFGQGLVPYTAVTTMKKEQACPEMAHNQANNDAGVQTITKAWVWPLTVLGPGWQKLRNLSKKESKML